MEVQKKLIVLELNIFRKKQTNKKRKFIESKNIITYIYRIKACYLIISEYFYIGFIDFMLKVKSLLDYTNLLSRNTKIE